MGNLFREARRLPTACELYLLAVSRFASAAVSEPKTHFLIGVVHNNLAQTYQLNSSINQALTHYKQSLACFRPAGDSADPRLVQDVCLKIGGILKKQNKANQAVYYLHKA